MIKKKKNEFELHYPADVTCSNLYIITKARNSKMSSEKKKTLSIYCDQMVSQSSISSNAILFGALSVRFQTFTFDHHQDNRQNSPYSKAGK